MYKNFTAFNAAIQTLKMGPRALLAQRLINLCQSLMSTVSDLADKWSRAYATVMQLEYDSQGHIQDVTPPEAISSANAVIANAKANLDQLAADIASLNEQFENLPATVSIDQSFYSDWFVSGEVQLGCFKTGMSASEGLVRYLRYNPSNHTLRATKSSVSVNNLGSTKSASYTIQSTGLSSAGITIGQGSITFYSADGVHNVSWSATEMRPLDASPNTPWRIVVFVMDNGNLYAFSFVNCFARSVGWNLNDESVSGASLSSSDYFERVSLPGSELPLKTGQVEAEVPYSDLLQLPSPTTMQAAVDALYI